MSPSLRRKGALGAALVLLLSVLSSLIPSPAGAATVVAADLTDGGPTGLVSFTNSAPPFTSSADGFAVYQRNVSPSIPFALLDDTLTVFPTDTLGIIDETMTSPFFGATDVINDDNAGPVTATWVFDITGETDLSLQVDVGAMGDFEATDDFSFAYAIDGGAATPVFPITVDEAADRVYTLASGTTVTLADPLNAGAAPLSNVLTTLSAPITGTGSTLTVTFTAETDGGSEAVAFRNLIVMGDTGGGGPTPGDLVLNEVMQNPAAVGDSAGEWFEIANLSDTAVDLRDWTIGDNDTDNYRIDESVVVPAGGYAILGNNADTGTNGGVTVDHRYSDFFLANGADEIVLSDPDGVEFDRIEYDGGPTWPDPNGAAMNLDPAAQNTTDNDDGDNWCEATTPFGAGDNGTPGAANVECVDEPPTIRFIHEIQGTGPTVAIAGEVTVQAVVTTRFEDDDTLDGFLLQEEDADAALDPNGADASEGIFVFCRGACPADLAVGDLVTVTGGAGEFFGMSQIASQGGEITIDSSDNALPAPIAVDLPAAGSTLDAATFEHLEGMIVTFPDELVVSEYFELARYGQVVLTETSRPFQFTHGTTPSVDGYQAFLDELATRRIILDDLDNDQNEPINGPLVDEPYFYPEGGLSVDNDFRGGDSITGLVGVLHWSFAGQRGTDAWRVRPIPERYDYLFDVKNPEPAAPSPVGGSLTVASFNVLNYFTTIDVTSSNSSGDCGPSGTLDCRGADSQAELERQTAKIVDALATMDADVVGLIEIENDAGASTQALVDALNAEVGAGTYDFIDTGFIGTDAIKVALIYRPGTVSPLGDHVILDSSIDPSFIDTENRPVLIQTFQEDATLERFTVAVNHLKSKGSPCDDLGDPDAADGQGNCAGVREAAAIALAEYLATDPTNSGDPDTLIIGDLNAYRMEDAITALEARGYTDLVEQFEGDDAYSFVFDGQLGYLDHALGNAAMTGQVTGVDVWHSNADEVNLFDYNDDIRDGGEASFEEESNGLPIYAPDAYRSSDHDPVIVGLALDSIPDNPTCLGLPATIVGTPSEDSIDAGNGIDVIVTFGGHDVVEGGNGDDVICTGFGDDVIDGGRGDDRVDAGGHDDTIVGDRGDDELDGGDGIDAIDGGSGTDTCIAGEEVIGCEF